MGCGVSVSCGGVAVSCGVADGGNVGMVVDRGDTVGVGVPVGDVVATTSGGMIAGLLVLCDQAHTPPAPPPTSSATPAIIAQCCHTGFDVAA